MGITTGCGSSGGQLLFCPGDPVPRQQMAAFLIRAKGLTPLSSATPTFADVPAGNPFYGWIERLFEQGITTGCGTNGSGQRIYCPGEDVPRQQMAAFLIRAFG
jgi:spore germination protein